MNGNGLAPPPRITILTGAAGWLGRALLHGYTGRGQPGVERTGTIRALVRNPADVDMVASLSDRIEVRVGDMNDAEVLRRLFAGAEGASVVHAAGVIHPRVVEDFTAVNVAGTRAVVEAALGAGVGRFVHISSNSPFGVNPTPADVFRADEPYRPYLGYGRSKMEAELVVRTAAEQAGLPAVIVRPPWFYGPHQPLRQTSFFRLVRRGRFPVFGRGENRRSMVYVDNLVAGVALAERHPAAVGNAYWIADARPYAMCEVVDTVRAAMADEGLSVWDRQVNVPMAVGALAERADRMLQRRGRYFQSIHVLGELNKTIACDVTPARRQLGYEPAVDLREGMRRSIRWCLDQGIPL